MEDLSGLYRPRLVTDSMSGGGTVHQSYGMTAAGSPPIDGLPQGFEWEDLANVMQPGDAAGPTVLVDADGAHASQPAQGGSWDEPGMIHEGSSDRWGWRET